jgi:cytochrome c6
MSLRRWIATLLVALALFGLVTACSDDEGSPSEDAGSDEGEQAGAGAITGPPIDELDGGELFATYCSACHQPEGAGIDGVYPALADNPFVALDDPSILAQTVVHGRAGMPAWDTSLTDTEIAAILTYLRTELNDADAVDPEVVREARDREGLDDEARDEDESGNAEEQGSED